MPRHDEHCPCAACRHARFAPGAPSRRRQVANFYGHFSYHPKAIKSVTRGGASVGSVGGQTSGPITFGAPDFLKVAKSKNKYRAAPGLTIRWLT